MSLCWLNGVIIYVPSCPGIGVAVIAHSTDVFNENVHIQERLQIMEISFSHIIRDFP